MEGSAVIGFDCDTLEAEKGSVVVINSNELHSGIKASTSLAYYCIDIDASLLKERQPDSNTLKLPPSTYESFITFNNLIADDRDVTECITAIIEEYETNNAGRELMLKSRIYKLLALLLRSHVKKVLSHEEYASKIKKLQRIEKILNFIENNYIERISVDQLSRMAGVSSYYFCRLFKSLTGKTVNEYIIGLRLGKAEALLTTTNMNVTEVAFASGFSDANYFSRMFKKHRNVPPSSILKKLVPVNKSHF